jgi:hypothetical protein
VEVSGISAGETTISILKAECYAPFRGQAPALRGPGVVSYSSDIYFRGQAPALRGPGVVSYSSDIYFRGPGVLSPGKKSKENEQ